MGLSQNSYSVCVHGDEGTCHPVQQCGSMAQRKKIYQALIHTQYLYIDTIDTFTAGLALLMEFVGTCRKMYHQT